MGIIIMLTKRKDIATDDLVLNIASSQENINPFNPITARIDIIRFFS